jgi:hypothetical protein
MQRSNLVNLVRQIAVILATTGVIVVNGLANALPINGKGTGEISDSFDVFFVPAGYVFSIWGVIYLLLVAFAIFQALPAQREDAVLNTVGWVYVLSCIANVAWIFLWHYERFPLTLVAMLTLLGCLIACYLLLGVGQREVSAGYRWLVHLPFSVYLGWITVATVANVTDVLDYAGWGGWGIAPEAWAVIMLVVATALTAAMLFTRRDAAYALVIIWAFVGIALKQAESRPVSIAAWVLTALIAVLLIAALLVGRSTPQTAAA